MDDSEYLLEPIDGYTSHYKDLHKKNTEEYFDELVKKSKINIEGNKESVKKYNAKVNECTLAAKKLDGKKGLRGFIIFLMVVFILAGVVIGILGISGTLPMYAGILGFIFSVGILVGGIFLIVKGLNATIKKLKEAYEKLAKERDALKQECYLEMAPLNALFDWGMSQEILTKTVPLIKMDPVFDEEKFVYLNKKYGFMDNTDEHVSTTFVQSGSILGNPFLILRDYHQKMENKRYEGSLTICWTETVGFGKDRRTVTRTQTLIAAVYKPAPYYFANSRLIYGNESAPNLTFSRAQNPNSSLEGKKLEKYISKESKKLDEKAASAIKNGKSYTKLGNDEFEAIFGGTDRNNELEYRLLYTPLAQKNILKLLRSKEGYGDDFSQIKAKCLNYIRSTHSQLFNYDADPLHYLSYDYEVTRKKFLEYNENYFKGIYFDFAPLLSVPEYQQHKSREFIYNEPVLKNISSYETEAIANSFDSIVFKPDKANTASILKASFESKVGEADNVNITAHAFRGERRLTYVSELGGDGRLHQVPVYWIEYIPVEKKTKMMLEKKNSSRFEYNATSGMENFKKAMSNIAKDRPYLYQHGLFAAITGAAVCEKALNDLNAAYKTSTDALKSLTGNASLDKLLEQLKKEDEIKNKVIASQEENNCDKILHDEKAETKEVKLTDEEIKANKDAEAKAKEEIKKEASEDEENKEE